MDTDLDNTGKPDCVVIDTNIWRSELLLKTPVGASFVYTLGRQRAFLGLPEVVEQELTRQIVEAGHLAAEALEKSSRTINTLTDSPFPPSIPTDAALEEKVVERLRHLESILVRVPFTLEHARAALEMVNAKVAPNGEKNQQFKDSAIWQAVLALSSDYCVHLVTNDRAFLLNRNDPSLGLAKNLQEDCSKRAVHVGIYCDLAACLKDIRRDAPPVDHTRLCSLVLPCVEAPLRREAERNSVVIGEILNTDITAFRIANNDRLAVDYKITAQCDQDRSRPADSRTNIRAIVHGSCYYDPSAGLLSDHFLQYVTIEWNYTGGGHGRSIRSYEGEEIPIPFRRPPPWN
ncbi:MAG TPA: PIN domain-containing protein [Thermoguttaceae bacterium]|nr:PIN domain-containing protein [Thermoguttaceae bacterium]